MDYKNHYEVIAKENGFDYSDERSEILVFGIDYGNKVRTEFCALSKNDITYFSYDMFAPRAYMNNTYSGVYTTLDGEAEFAILKRVNPLLNFILCGVGQKQE